MRPQCIHLSARLVSLVVFFLLVFPPCAQRAAAAAPQSWFTEEHLADVLLYQVLLDESRYDDAWLVLQRLLSNDGGGSYVLCLEAEYSFLMLDNKFPGDWLERAGQATWWAMQTDERHWRVLYNRARWLALSGRRKDALACVLRTAENSDTPDLVLFWAYDLAEELRVLQECVRILELLQARGALDEKGVHTLGSLYSLEGRHDEALRLLSRDGDSASLLAIAAHYVREGEYVLAGRYAHALLARVPNHPEGVLFYACALLHEDKNAEVLAFLTRWKDAGGRDTNILIVLADIYASYAEWERALEVLELVPEESGEKASVLIARGRVLLKCKRAREALPQLKRALALSVSFREKAELLLLLGDAYLAQERTQNTLSNWRNIQENTGEQPLPPDGPANAVFEREKFSDEPAAPEAGKIW